MSSECGWPLELLIVLVIVLVIFGAKRLPEIGRSLGAGAREFKDGITGKTRPRRRGHQRTRKPEDEKVA